MTQRLAHMTWPDADAAVAGGAATVILPLGATEQHGPHLPLGTDTVRAAALAERLAAGLPDALVAPALPVGCSDEHQGFPGLIGLDHETLAAVIVDCARRLAGWGVRRLVLLSAHGGNRSALDLAAGRMAAELPGLRVVVLGGSAVLSEALLAVAAADGIPADAVGLHAGEGETSEMLALRPDLVRRDRAVPGCRTGAADLMPRLRRDGLRGVTATGVLGDAAHADAARGALYLAVQVESWRQTLAGDPALHEESPS
jgi:creatinine amidohydrolase